VLIFLFAFPFESHFVVLSWDLNLIQRVRFGDCFYTVYIKMNPYCFFNLSTRSELVVTATPRSLYVLERDLTPRVLEDRWALGRVSEVRKISTTPGFDHRTFHYVASRYTDWTIYICMISCFAHLPSVSALCMSENINKQSAHLPIYHNALLYQQTVQ
jgi:hypothetical protein